MESKLSVSRVLIQNLSPFLKLISKAVFKLNLVIDRLQTLSLKFAVNLCPYQALNNLDYMLAQLAPELLSSKTFYIEAGANDGIRQSNTLFLEKLYGAKGLLIEPSQINFEKCIQNRSPSNIFEHCALVSSSYEHEYVDLFYADLMTPSTTINHSINHAKKGQSFMKIKQNYIISAKARTLHSVLEQHSIRNISLLSLDVEGYELEVLDGLQLSNHKILYILVETSAFEQVQFFLSLNNYSLVSALSHHDYLFKLILE